MMRNRIFVICVVALAAVFALTEVGTAAVMEQSKPARRPPIYNPPRDTGDVVYQFTAPFNNIDGMAWDGEYIWLGCDGLDSLWQMDTLGNILLTIPAPNLTATGLCWDGQYLWCADGGTIRIYKLDPATGAILDSIDAPVATSCEGLAWMNDTMWNTNWNNNIIYALDPTNGNIWFQYNAPNTGSTGLAWDWHDSALWNTSQTAPGTIYKLDPGTGAVITQFASPDPIPQDLAFDGTYLWTCGWTTGEVYKMDIGYTTGIEEKPFTGNIHAFGFAPSIANPVSGRCSIAYSTATQGTVSLKVYNSAGRLVKTLVNSAESAGAKTVFWDAKDDNQRTVANGIYFLKLDAEGQTATHKLILVK
jgi:hypothetical protein